MDWTSIIRADEAEEEDEDVDPDDVDIKEKKIDPKKQKPQAEPKYRYRGKWGDTDTLFKREDEEIEKRNLILEIGHLR